MEKDLPSLLDDAEEERIQALLDVFKIYSRSPEPSG